MAPVLLTPPGSFGVKVHPVVLFSICDAFVRRNDKQERVIGTLLGSVADGVVEVKNCYVVPHNESQDQVLRRSEPVLGAAGPGADAACLRGDRLPWTSCTTRPCTTCCTESPRQSTSSAGESWAAPPAPCSVGAAGHAVTPITGQRRFSTGVTISSSDALIHDFYGKECSNPVSAGGCRGLQGPARARCLQGAGSLRAAACRRKFMTASALEALSLAAGRRCVRRAARYCY
jgi:hypothetical protein